MSGTGYQSPDIERYVRELAQDPALAAEATVAAVPAEPEGVIVRVPAREVPRA
jgi:hypothetical protein